MGDTRQYHKGKVKEITHCVSCGKLLVRREGEQTENFKRRKTCGGGTRCHTRAVSSSLREVFRNGFVPVPGYDSSVVLYDNPMDAEQAAINIMCAKLDAERTGLTLDPGRILTPEEVAQIHITPIERIPHTSADRAFLPF